MTSLDPHLDTCPHGDMRHLCTTCQNGDPMPEPEPEDPALIDARQRFQDQGDTPTAPTEPVQHLVDGHLMDIPVGRQYAATIRRKFKYVSGIGWHSWDGARWGHDEGTHQEVISDATTWAHQMITRMVTDSSVTRADIHTATRYRSIGNIKRMVEAARTDPTITARAHEMDQHPTLINCPNGIVDLATGQLRPSDPEMLFTKVTQGEYQPEHTHADWDKALQALPTESQGFLQLRMGQSLYGEATPTDELIVNLGGGENGKGTIVGVLLATLGDFAGMVPDSVMILGHREHPTDMMTLRGLRLALIEELPEGKRLNVSRMKKIVGTDRIKGRYMNHDFVEFKPTHTLFISTNYPPIVDETDHGTLRRIVILPYPYTFIKEDADIRDPDVERRGDPGLKRRMDLPQQQSAALTWAIQGAVKYAEQGRVLPTPPPDVARAIDEWRDNSDPLGQYIGDRLEFDPNGIISATQLLDDFNKYTGNGRANWGIQKFNQTLRSHQILIGHDVTRPTNPVAAHLLTQQRGDAEVSNRVRAWKGLKWS